MYIFLHIPSPYMTEPQPRPLGEAVAHRSRRPTELQKRALRHRAPLVAHRLPSCGFLLASTAIAIVIAWCECQLRLGSNSALPSPTQFLVSTPPMAVSVQVVPCRPIEVAKPLRITARNCLLVLKAVTLPSLPSSSFLSPVDENLGMSKLRPRHMLHVHQSCLERLCYTLTRVTAPIPFRDCHAAYGSPRTGFVQEAPTSE